MSMYICLAILFFGKMPCSVFFFNSQSIKTMNTFHILHTKFKFKSYKEFIAEFHRKGPITCCCSLKHGHLIHLYA